MAVTAESHTGSSFKSPEAFRTISEVSGDLNLPQHVLRFWETRFAQIKPMKRGGGRRLYRPDHVALLRGIKALLYDDGMTIKGVQKVLREKGTKTVIARGSANVELTLESAALPPDASERLSALKDRVEAERTVEAADSVEAVNPDKIRASISSRGPFSLQGCIRGPARRAAPIVPGPRSGAPKIPDFHCAGRRTRYNRSTFVGP
jgi:DNA-binding transcriptional MerR regulator